MKRTSIKKINKFLDSHILPWPVRFFTQRFVILGTMLLLIPLTIWATNTWFVLAVNSYLNVMSVVVSSVVLLYSRSSTRRTIKNTGRPTKAHTKQTIDRRPQVVIHIHNVADLKTIMAELNNERTQPLKLTSADNNLMLLLAGKEENEEVGAHLESYL